MSDRSGQLTFKLMALQIIAASLLFIAALLTSNFAIAQSDNDETFTINLANADIRSLISTVSLQTGKNFIVDPRVKATVTVISATPVTKDKLYELFLSVLAVRGFATIPAGDIIKIVPTAAGVQGPVPVLSE